MELFKKVETFFRPPKSEALPTSSLDRLYPNFNELPLETKRALSSVSMLRTQAPPPKDQTKYTPMSDRLSNGTPQAIEAFARRSVSNALTAGIPFENIEQIINLEEISDKRWDKPILKRVLESFSDR